MVPFLFPWKQLFQTSSTVHRFLFSHLPLILNRWFHLSTSFYFTEGVGNYSFKFLQITLQFHVSTVASLVPFSLQRSIFYPASSLYTYSSLDNMSCWIIFDLSYWFFSIFSLQIFFPIDSTASNIFYWKQEERKLPPTRHPSSTLPCICPLSQSQISFDRNSLSLFTFH